MNVLELMATLGLDKSEYEKGLSGAEGDATSAGGKIGNALATMGKVGAVAIGAASTAVVGLAKSAVDSYSAYEQLSGGVSKLYGTAGMSVDQYAQSVGKSVEEVKGKYDELTKAQDLVMQNASNAYKTSGMDMNKYMETATQFSASLISSLGGDTVKAAEQTDVAMRAISDNVNTFGSNMEDVTNAFKGFSKQNYTMLDNLKLGYGGTKQEMARLIEDANAYAAANGKAADLSINSFSDIVTAIQLVQEKQQIAGTTAREAMSTLEGSGNMAKAAWQNVLTAIGTGEGLDEAFNGLITALVGDESGGGFINNLVPVVERTMDGIGRLVTEAAPIIIGYIPMLVEQLVPGLLSGAVQLVAVLVTSLPSILVSLGDALVQSMLSILNILSQTILGYPIGGDIGTMMASMSEAFLEWLPEFLNDGVELLTSIVNGILENLPMMIDAAGNIISGFLGVVMDALPSILSAGVNLVLNLVKGIINNLPQIVSSALQLMVKLLTTIGEHLPEMLQKGMELVTQLIVGLINEIPNVASASVKIVGEIIKTIVSNLPGFLSKGVEVIQTFINGITSMLSSVASAAGKIIGKVGDVLGDVKDKAIKWGKDMIDGFIEGIKKKIGEVKEAIANVAGTVASNLHFSRPDEGPLREYEQWMPDFMEGLARGINDNAWKVKDAVSNVTNSMSRVADVSQSEYGSGSFGGSNVVNITVYGAQGQDVKELADVIEDKINGSMIRRRTVWA